MHRIVLSVQELVWMVREGDFSTEAEHVACDREGGCVTTSSENCLYMIKMDTFHECKKIRLCSTSGKMRGSFI